MKTNQELLDFYGVEIGKKYRTNNPLDNLYIFKVVKSINGDLCIVSEDGATERPITWLNIITYEEMPPSILDDKEREYLQHYVMDNPAFKGKVLLISKQDYGNNECYIQIQGRSESIVDMYDYCTLPVFKINDMYKGMKINKDYTPKELGLEE